jgi:hypothetical protein
MNIEGLTYMLRIDGMNKTEADELVARTPLKAIPHHHRGLWGRTALISGGVLVGNIECNRSHDPLHITIDLNALKAHDPDWQTTLESLGVLG